MKKGDLLLFTEGDYSDYRINCLVRCLQDFKINAEETKNRIRRESHLGPALSNAYVADLIKAGLVETVDYREIHSSELEGNHA